MFGGVTLPQVNAPYGNSPQAIWGAYNQSQHASTAANQQLFNWFGSNSNQILGTQQGALGQAFHYLLGANRANVRSIDRDYAAKSGSLAQSLIGAGLGNATIQGSMQRGLDVSHSDALSGSRGAFAGRLFDAATQAALANSGLAQQQVNTAFGGTNIGYPDFGAYAHAAGLAGAQGAMGGMGGPGVQFDPSRPVGGAQPAWAYASSPYMDPGVGGGGYNPGGGMNPAPWGPNTSGLYPAGVGKGESGYLPGTETYGGGVGAMPYGAASPMNFGNWAGNAPAATEATGYY